MFSQLLSGIKVKLVDKMIQSNYLRDILHVKRKTLLILTVFTRVLILEKSKMATMCGDVTDLKQRHQP